MLAARRSIQKTAILVAALVGVGALRAQPFYSVTDLGALPGTTTSVAAGINDRGDIVGSCSSADANSQVGFVWRNGVMTSTGKLPKGTYSYATAVNFSGVVVGDGDTGDGRPQSWVTGSSGLINFFPNNGGNTHALAISDAGAIGGYYTKSLSGNTTSWRGAIWTVDPKDSRKWRALDLPILPGTNASSIPWGFNQFGQAAGWAVNSEIGQHACFWNNNASHSIVDLGVYPGDWSSIAWAINDVGQVVGESHPPFGSRPVLWNNDAARTAIELPFLPGDNYGVAQKINNHGQILGWSAYGTPGTWDVTPSRLVLWSDGAVYELQSLVDPAAGWTISSAAALNNAGQIAASGLRNGIFHALLLTPLP